MEFSKLLLIGIFLGSGSCFYAQADSSVVKENARRKSITYSLYKAHKKNGQIIRGKETWIWKGYPIHYPSGTTSYDQNGNPRERNDSNQRDLIYYNETGQKERMVLFPDHGTDSITIDFHYDTHGNIELETMKTTNPEMGFCRGGNYYFHQALRDTHYENYYTATIDSTTFDTIPLRPGNYYCLFDSQNNLLEEKYIYITQNNPYFASPRDTTFYRKRYQYNDADQIIEKRREIRYSKNDLYTTRSREVLEYTDDGQVLNVKHYDDKELYETQDYTYRGNGILERCVVNLLGLKRKKIYFFNDRGDLCRYQHHTKRKLKIDIRLEYVYNQQGEWIRCIHFDKKGRPRFWIQRDITYFGEDL